MKHEFDAALLADDRLATLARRAAAHLDWASDGTAIPAEAAWRLAPPGGTGPVEVVIRDAVGAESVDQVREREFDEDELRFYTLRRWVYALTARSDVLARRRLAADPAGAFAS